MSRFENFIGLANEGLDSCPDSPSVGELYMAMVERAVTDMKILNQQAVESHGLDTMARAAISQEEGLLRFLDENGTARVSTPITLIGTFSPIAQTWRWGWANPSIRPPLVADLEKVRAYGDELSLLDLTEPAMETDEDGAWSMAAMALKILGGQGVYHHSTGDVIVFMIMKEIESA